MSQHKTNSGLWLDLGTTLVKRTLLSVGLALVPLSVNSVEAQMTWQAAGVSTPPPEPFLRVSSCVVGEGGYVKQGAAVIPDVIAQNSGRCEAYWAGQLLIVFQRWISLSAHVRHHTPTHGQVDYGIIFPDPSSTHYDDTRSRFHAVQFSTSAAQTGPEQTHTFYYNTISLSTSCNIQPTDSATVTRTATVLKCQPVFDNGHVGPPASPNKVKVYLPTPDMDSAYSALEFATNTLNGVLPTDVQFEIVRSSCGTGPACIQVGTAANVTGCGSSSFNIGLLGVASGNIVLNLATDWNTPNVWTTSGLKRTLLHELTHFLGLTDAPACMAYEPAMYKQFDCRSGLASTSLQPSDYLPILKSIYGPGAKTTCGF